MHTELKDWLWWTWSNREEIMQHSRGHGDVKGREHLVKYTKNPAVDMIYGYYTKTSIPKPTVEEGDISKFQERIIRIKNGLPNASLTIQTDDWINDANETDVRFMLPSQVETAWFHFRKARQTSSHRICINIKKRPRLRAFYDLTRLIWNMPGVLTCKVAGPGAHRADTVVMYFDNAQHRQAALDKMYPYAVKHRHYFDADRPKLTKAVDGLVGFGLGTQPPKVQIVRVKHDKYAKKTVNHSFGSYRAHIIFMALDRSDIVKKYAFNAMPKWFEFKWRAENYFRVAGIDPDAPWGQGDVNVNKPFAAVAREVALLEKKGIKTGWAA